MTLERAEPQYIAPGSNSSCPWWTLASLPWIKLVDDALEPDHREKSGAESRQAGQEKNAEGE